MLFIKLWCTEKTTMLLVKLHVMLLSAKIISAGILDPFNWARADRLEVNIPWLPFENETRCYDELGCLNITRSWYHLIHRPFNVFPLPRSVINTRFILYTRLNPFEIHLCNTWEITKRTENICFDSEEINVGGQERHVYEGQIIKAQEEKINKSNFDPKKRIKFIIHGFIDTPLSNWVGDMRDELLKAEDLNVIVVDWAGGSLPLYTQATANTRLVGLELGYFIKYLVKNYGLDAADVHIIGHSLGAHTAGYAGSMIHGLGRITGLDPAEPYFQGMPAHIRLDPSDAELVDVIHTDGKSIFFLGYGMSQPCGHIDFYPNNGKEQPGCDITQSPLVPLTLIRDGLEEASRVLVACNHVRAIKLFTDSINSQCPYIAHQCPSYQHFLAGKCFTCKPGSGTCAIMGYHTDSSPGMENEIAPQSSKFHDTMGTKFFTATGREYPYCHRLYRVSIQLAKPATAEPWVQGFIKASLHSPSGVVHLDLTPSGDMKLEHGTTYAVVVSHPADLGGNIKKVELNWEYDMNVLEPRTLCLLWCNDHLYVKSVSVDQMELPGRGKRDTHFSSKLCSPSKRDYADIANRGRAVFLDVCKNPLRLDKS